MFIGRLSTKFSKFSDYIISVNPLNTIKYAVPGDNNESIIYDDFEIRGDCVIMRYHVVEENLGIHLEGLETKEI